MSLPAPAALRLATLVAHMALKGLQRPQGGRRQMECTSKRLAAMVLAWCAVALDTGCCHKGKWGDMFLDCAQGGSPESEQAYDGGGESRRCCKFSESLRSGVPPRTPERGRKRKHLDN